MDRTTIINLMAARRLFAGATPEVLGELVDHGEEVTVPAGEILIHQGKIGEAVWILLDGTVQVEVDDTSCHLVATPGTALGEISAISHTAATATVTTHSPVIALKISHDAFHHALRSSQKLAASVLKSLSKYL